MSANSIIFESRMTHIRELKTELEKLRRENAALRDENASVKSHLDLAVLAAEELGKGETIELWDGWNMILDAKVEAHNLEDLVAMAKAKGGKVWIVMDGPKENVINDGDVRVSYTGGTGEHRADRFIIDFVRMARYIGRADQVTGRTNDKDFRLSCLRLQSMPQCDILRANIHPQRKEKK